MGKSELYVVKWKIEVDAKSAKDAAKQALKIQRDNDSLAIVFEVSKKSSVEMIDLEFP